MKYERQLLG